MLSHYIAKLLSHQSLTLQECEHAAGYLLDDKTDELQKSVFLTLLRFKSETTDELLGLLNIMRSKMIEVPTTERVLDIVGTGGDGLKTVNISTGAAILAASCGVKIAKHGSHAVSSLCGSADVLEELGVNIHLSPEKIAEGIDQLGIGFCYAPDFHPAFSQLKTLRKRLNFPTTFNLLGPLLNPAGASHYLIGVYDAALLKPLASVLERSTVGRSFVFHGNGLDEISTCGKTTLIEVAPSETREYILDPSFYGFKSCQLDELQGGSSKDNAKILLDTLTGKKGAIADALILNAALAVFCYGLVDNLSDAIDLAKSRLQVGAAFNLLQKWIEFTTRGTTDA